MSDYIDVKINVFEHTDQRARLLESLTPAGLIKEILKEFDDIVGDAPEKYAIYLQGMDRPLTPTSTMAELDIQPHDTLVFDYVRQPIRKMLEPEDYAYLREETTGKVFDIQWQPAVIGRPDSDAGHNLILAVNVQSLPNARSVSRKHAQITFSEGRYYIEPLAEHNPAFLNGKEIPLNSKREIKNNDKLTIGHAKLTMAFETKRLSTSAAVKPKSQPVKIVSPPPNPVPAGQAVIVPPELNGEMNMPPTPAPVPVGQAVVEPSNLSATVLSLGKNPITSLVIENSSTPEKVGQKLTMLEYPFLLGRTLPLLSNENGISRRHAEITYDANNNKFYITDLKSTNGVTVDEVPIQPEEPVEIKPGSKLGFGIGFVLKFEIVSTVT